MNIGIIAVVIMLTFLILITWACIFNNVCIGCNEPATRCKSCKHYGPPLVASNYEPKEFDIDKETLKKFDKLTDEEKGKIVAYWNKRMSPALSNLVEQINNLSNEEFMELEKQVRRGYENGRD